MSVWPLAVPVVAPVNWTSVRPVGSRSSIRTPVEASGPALASVRVKVSTSPCTAVALDADLVSERSALGAGGGGALTVVVAEPLLLSVRDSVVVVAAEAVLTSAPETPVLTRAVSVKVADSPEGDVPVRAKRTVCPDVLAAQPVG